MELTEHKIDKTTWGDGPWQHEPDRAEWEHAGLPCLAVRAGGHWCGYAAVPPGHPWYGVPYSEYDTVNVDVHGGLTYSDACQGHVCHVPKPGEPDDVWWFGFDCNHSGDYSPQMAVYARQQGHDWYHDRTEQYRTLDYVRAEVNRLAEQLKERADVSL